MALWEAYHQPRSLEEAIAVLDSYQGAARIIAGGTDLLLEMQQGRQPTVPALVDVSAIPTLSAIVCRGDWLEIGAAATHTQIVGNSELVRQATCLVESCGVIGGPQVRNVATLGGNVAHALPAADGTTSLVALDAEAEIVTSQGRAWQPILSLFVGPGKPTFSRGASIISRFRFQTSPRSGTAFSRIMRPQGVALPILACAVWLQLDADLVTVSGVRICIGPVGPVPTRVPTAEARLMGRQLSESLDSCLASARASLEPRTSKHRATSAYRAEMADVLLQRTLPLAAERARSGRAVPQGLGW